MLNKLLMAGIILFISAQVKADDSQKVSSKIQKVTIFLNSGQVTRTATASIKPGTTTLVFDHIAPDIDAQSVQVHATGDFTILSVTPEVNVANEQTRQKTIDDLLAQQKVIKDKIAAQTDLMSIYLDEEKLLKNQLTNNTTNATVDIVKLKQALDFQTARLTELKKNEMLVTQQVDALNTELQKINALITTTENSGSKKSSNILVTVSSVGNTVGQFTLSYRVYRASWTPVYNIRAKDVKSPVTIVYKAKVTQQSGEDWKDVKLTLSTGNPNVNANRPDLSPYYLDIPKYEMAQDKRSNQLNEVVIVRGMATQSLGKVYGMASVPGVTQQENQTATEFNINTPFSVNADGKQATVEMNQVELPAKYEYYAAPKINTNVFLTALVTDWNKYNFLPGDMNLFFEGTYIGKSYLNSRTANDTLKLSLGTDKNIVVTRTLQKNLTGKQGIASNRKETRDWLIEVKNRKSQPINLLLEDQIPVSENTDIVVDAKELSGGKLDTKTGLIAWNFTLAPLDNKKAVLSYQVRLPKNQLIAVQ
ncbi:DUF4139 domain-containing protein [Mucilaginibacter boryungensis]|uniref:DUF4139 domain-containing protein n=1 Tax=Mucilaginibacter boryungensis TaxID=768480 RepID=A0ABR9XE77_9SPHI|nr:DUF4139 domain-containing protein [Mucilaginibacter boryungensis]MBE9665566.1 DUF4139 domain-containing protein [Mucilaginibacter boryungensis]